MTYPQMQRSEWILQVSQVIFEYGAKYGSQDAYNLGTNLHLISGALKDPYLAILVEEEIPRWPDFIKELEFIFTGKHGPSDPRLSKRVKQNIVGFLGRQDHGRKENLIAKSYHIRKLYNGESPIRIPARPPKQAQDEYPEHIRTKLLSGLKGQSRCFQQCTGDNGGQRNPRHCTRLLLQQGIQQGRDIASFDIILSSDPMKFWRDIVLKIPLKAMREDPSLPNNPHEPQAPGSCKLLETNNLARIRFDFVDMQFEQSRGGFALKQRVLPGVGMSLYTVLQHYELDVKVKIFLAYSIALTFWQFYDMKDLRHKWSSRSIFFMPENGGQRERLPNKPYISIQFEPEEEETKEYSNADSLIHQHPRILSLAILLLEIGLGKPLQLQPRDNLVAQLNSDFDVATQSFIELSRGSWPNFCNKNYYDKAIGICLNYALYRSQQAPDAPANTATSNSSRMSQRRKIIRDNVVWPLRCLAKIGFWSIDEKNIFLSRRAEPEPLYTIRNDIQPMPTPSTIRNHEQPMTITSFHTGDKIDPEMWLDYLKVINKTIQGLRQGCSGSKRIRVAVLDTGYDPDVRFFQDDTRSNRVKGWKDFVSDSQDPVDVYGHGTMMTELVIETAPVAEVFVARVAENTERLEHSASQIAEAIRWAGLDKEVDIVTMSFGFPAKNKGISSAIYQVLAARQGNIIFLASAGNFGPHQNETFPATHPIVISMRATTPLGVFLDTNPIKGENQAYVFGTYSDYNIPQELREHPPRLVCESGTSVATAIAGGIAAIILSFITVLRSSANGDYNNDVIERAWTVDGIQKIFYRMSNDMGNRKRFLNPLDFFTGPFTLKDRCNTIYNYLQET